MTSRSTREDKSALRQITSSRTNMATSLLAILLTLSAVEGLALAPKLDLSGIEVEHHKQLTLPTEVKTILKVNLVDSDPSEVLICTLDGRCKLHPIKGVKKSEDEQEEGKEKYKPMLVTDLDLDAEDDDDEKASSEVPVIVATKGAAPDMPPHPPSWEQETERLPVYFGLKLGPEFHQPDRVVLQPIEYAPLADVPDHVALRYPKPYGKFIPRDGVRTVIKPLGRRSGAYWTTPKMVAVNDKVDMDVEVPSTDDEVKVVSKLGELLGE